MVDSYNILIDMKDLRNELAYEYVEEKLMEKSHVSEMFKCGKEIAKTGG